jgi:hypothetical protein
VQEVLQVVLEDVAAGVIVAAAGATVLWLTRLPKKLIHMTDDWFGEDARPGVEGRPGVMVRLQNIERSQTTMGIKLTGIEHEMNFNSGQSIKDAVHRIDGAVVTLQATLEGHLSRNTQETNAMMDRVIQEHDA